MTKNFKTIVAAVTLGLFCLAQVGLAAGNSYPAPHKQCPSCQKSTHPQ